MTFQTSFSRATRAYDPDFMTIEESLIACVTLCHAFRAEYVSYAFQPSYGKPIFPQSSEEKKVVKINLSTRE